jgi:hypothetical protein
VIDSTFLLAQAAKLQTLAEEAEDGPLRTALLHLVVWYERAASEIRETPREPQ